MYIHMHLSLSLYTYKYIYIHIYKSSQVAKSSNIASEDKPKFYDCDKGAPAWSAEKKEWKLHMSFYQAVDTCIYIYIYIYTQGV